VLFSPLFFAPCSLVGFVRCTGGHALNALYVLLRPKAASDLPEDLISELTTPFSLGWTGSNGHLLLVDPASGPELHLGFHDPAKLSPHGLKLMSDRTYECYFIRHPDLAWVKKAQAELNGMLPASLTRGWRPTIIKPAIEKYQPPRPAKDQPLPPSYQVLTLAISEEPGQYYPKGASQYGDWLLYKDMPNAECPLVKKHVKLLQERIGALRYMVGSEHPYVPERLVKSGENKETANEGYFDGRTINSVYLFQQHVQSGVGWTVGPETVATAGREETEATSLKYLVGVPYTGGPKLIHTDGVVDQVTADALDERLRLGICNPMKIMVCLPARENGGAAWNVWMRPEAAAALYCWRELTRSLGFPETIAANHTFRSAAVNVGSAGFGRSWKSIHKVGLAIDVGLHKNYYDCADDWPVFYQQDQVEKKMKRGELDAVRIRWRVFAVSNRLIPGEAAIRECREALERVKVNAHPLGAQARAAAAKLIGEIADGTFAAKYFRHKIRQWQYDPWDGDGGKEGPEMSAESARAKQRADAEALFADCQAKRAPLQQELDALNAIPRNERTPEWKGARSNRSGQIGGINRTEAKRRALYNNYSPQASRFLDLTALAYESGLERIGSFSNHLFPTSTNEWGLGLLTLSTGKFNGLTKGIQTLKAQQPEFEIEIGDQLVKLTRIDDAFMAEFGAGRVECVVAATKEAGKKITTFCEKLRKFGARRLLRVPEGVTKTGEEWAAAVEAKLAEVKAAPVNKKDSSKGSTRKKDMAEWTFRLQPDYAATGAPIYFPPKTAVRLPSPGAPIGLEWWHFQVGTLIDRRAFGPLICEMGWTKETLLDDPLPELHYRFGMGYPQNAWTDLAG